MNDLINKIQNELPDFSKGQKQIARFILEHYDKAAFMTASRLGATVGVSESTVVRFATELGYDGYPHLQRALQEMIRNKLTSVQRMEVSSDRMGGRDVLQTVLHADMDMIRMTLDEIDRDAFQGAVDALTGAKRIYILGVRSASALANFVGFYFNLLFENVTLVRVADHTLIAKSDMASFVDSLIAPLSVINALIVAVGMSRRGEIEQTFNRLERIWEEYDVYEKPEDDAN